MSTEYEAGEVGMPSSGSGYSAVSVAVAVVGGIVGAYVLSWVYGPLEHYSPLVYANLFLTWAMGWLVGKVGQAFLRRKKINGRTAAVIVGAVPALFAVWFSWLTYIFVIAGYRFDWYTNFLLNPLELIDLMRYLAHEPMWRLGKSSSDGPAAMYYAVWVLELGGIVGVSVQSCLSFVKANKLCDRCGDWIKETGDVAAFLLPADQPLETINALSAGNASVLTTLERPGEGDESDEWIEAKGYACPDCQDEDSHVTVNLVALRLNKKSKKLERVEKILTRYARIDVETEKKIFEPAGGAAPQASVPAEAAPAES